MNFFTSFAIMFWQSLPSTLVKAQNRLGRIFIASGLLLSISPNIFAMGRPREESIIQELQERAASKQAQKEAREQKKVLTEKQAKKLIDNLPGNLRRKCWDILSEVNNIGTSNIVATELDEAKQKIRAAEQEWIANAQEKMKGFDGAKQKQVEDKKMDAEEDYAPREACRGYGHSSTRPFSQNRK